MAHMKTDTNKINATVIKSKCQTAGAEGEVVYGVEISVDGKVLYRFEDISAEREIAEKFAKMIRESDIEPEHYDDIAEDFAESQCEL